MIQVRSSIAYIQELSDSNGIPNTGTKSSWNDCLNKRYSNSSLRPILTTLPSGWIPQMVVVDAMFTIHTKPSRQACTLLQHMLTIYIKYALPHFEAGATEVHLLYDKPGQQHFNPKAFKHKKHDKLVGNKHECSIFSPTSLVQSNTWLNNLLCRNSKVHYRGHRLMFHAW